MASGSARAARAEGDHREGWGPFRRLMTVPLVVLLVFVCASAVLDIKRSRAEFHERTSSVLPQVISPGDSPYSVAKGGGVRNDSMDARNYASTTTAAIGEDLKFRFRIIRSTPDDQDELEYLRLREAIVDTPNEDLRTRSFGLFIVDADGNESPVRGSKFELMLDDYELDRCSHAGVSSVGEVRVVIGEASMPLEPLDDSSASYLPKAYLSDTRPIFTAPVGFAGRVLQVEGDLSLRLEQDELSSLDGTAITIRSPGQDDPQSVQSAHLGDVVGVAMTLHRANCTLTKISPVIRVTQSSGGDGYVKLVADDISTMPYEKNNPVGTAVLSVVGVRSPWLREIRGSSKFWGATCGDPVVLDRLFDGVLSGGVQVGPVFAFVPRDKCYTDLRWLTFNARVTQKGH